ncbi:competence protein ComGC [Salinibacillus kushneri]|uniref:ComG operon protein 3 n=1 Tax=Salinibacillus kushneri TaxID=237682 RepID=A0A1I0FX51_9BACI|nr:competence type IV pilus major pilin ComGC [Salinibacillus kushneri]SET62076.1 competence protein ComGC [Salinibacillus kushneri]
MKNEDGFTLIEMLIVLMIISVLILLTIPNISKHNTLIDEKGCDAYVELVQSEVQVYKLNTGSYPTSVDDLSDLSEDESPCPNGVEIDAQGNVEKID